MKRVLCFGLTLAMMMTLLMTSALAVDSEDIVIPETAKMEVVDGVKVYSDFTDTVGNYYDYYNPEDGSYFRWKHSVNANNSANAEVTAASAYTLIREFEFKFARSSLNGKDNNSTFKISYDAGRFSVSSYLYDHYQGKEVTTDESYGFTVKLIQDKFGFDKTIATLNTETGSADTKSFTCTKDKSYYFVMTPTDTLPDNTSTHMYYYKGDGSIEGKT